MLCSCVILLDKYVYFLPINNRYISRIFSFTDRISHAELKCAPNYVLRYLPISSIFFRCTISFTLNLLTGGSRNITILIWRKYQESLSSEIPSRTSTISFTISRYDQWISWHTRMSRVCTHLRIRLENTKIIF